jgi:hypothetical protein
MKTDFHRLAYYLVIHMLTLLFLVACNKDELPNIPQGKITSIRIALAGQEKGTTDIDIEYENADGIGGKEAPNVVNLQENSTYTGTISLWDGSKNPIKDVTNEYSVSIQATQADIDIEIIGKEVNIKTHKATTGPTSELIIRLNSAGKLHQVAFPLIIRQ